MQNEKQKRLLDSLLIQNESVSWYQKEMIQVLTQLKAIEDNGNLDGENTVFLYHELQGKLFYLLGKGIFERKIQEYIKQQIKKS